MNASHPILSSALSSNECSTQNLAKMRLVLAIATTGRAQILAETVPDILRQTRAPDLIVLSVAAKEDADPRLLEPFECPKLVVNGPRGLCAQRNRALEVLRPDDVLLLIDDDFLMAPDYIEQTLRLFHLHPDVVMATGTVLSDGIGGPGYDVAEGHAKLARAKPPQVRALTDIYNGYGCNMAIRARPVLERGLRFDERLPLYGWLEDVDFSRQLSAGGRIVRSTALTGVHLGTKTGRTKGVRLGYSQIANPVYLIRKGTMSPRRALRMVGQNVGTNLLRVWRPEPWIDRRGRLKGNLLALRDLLTGRMTPERALTLR
ncbi:MAG: glycosyltransferase [Rhodobacteraceae bacterium]|nr:glycosyltransferase [Paracoccaceae bacterium]